MVINFWRPVGGYTKANPLLNNPLAVCDPCSVKNSDTVHTGLDAHLFGGMGRLLIKWLLNTILHISGIIIQK